MPVRPHHAGTPWPHRARQEARPHGLPEEPARRALPAGPGFPCERDRVPLRRGRAPRPNARRVRRTRVALAATAGEVTAGGWHGPVRGGEPTRMSDIRAAVSDFRLDQEGASIRASCTRQMLPAQCGALSASSCERCPVNCSFRPIRCDSGNLEPRMSSHPTRRTVSLPRRAWLRRAGTATAAAGAIAGLNRRIAHGHGFAVGARARRGQNGEPVLLGSVRRPRHLAHQRQGTPEPAPVDRLQERWEPCPRGPRLPGLDRLHQGQAGRGRLHHVHPAVHRQRRHRVQPDRRLARR